MFQQRVLVRIALPVTIAVASVLVIVTAGDVIGKKAWPVEKTDAAKPIEDKGAPDFAKKQEHPTPWITSKQRLTVLSANDGMMHLRLNPEAKTGQQKITLDSITVIHLGPDHPPIVKTVYGTVPNTISGPPYMAMTGDGHYGFVTSRKSAKDSDEPELVSVIDLASDDLKVVQRVNLANPRMAVMHPDGKRLLIPYDMGIRVFEMRDGKLETLKDNPTDFRVDNIDISPRGDRIVGTGIQTMGGQRAVFVFSYRDGVITYQSPVKIDPALKTDWDGPYACRFTRDSKRIVIPNGWHRPSKGALASVFIAELSPDSATVTEVVPQVGDGIEGVALHPGGKFAVLSCLDDSPRLVEQAHSHLAVIDLDSKPARLLYHLPCESVPEGMEFSPDGTQLFMGPTYANRIVVYDVDGFVLKRQPFVIRVGHGPCSMAIGPRFLK